MEYPIRVSSDDDAWKTFEQMLSGDLSVDKMSDFEFDRWPLFKIYIPGARLDSSLTPYMMQGYVDFQRTIFRSHALLLHNDANARKLSDYEKQQLEIIVKVQGGSSDTEAELWKILSESASAAVGKMEPQHIITTVLGLGLLWASQSVLRTWLEGRKEQRIAEVQSEQQKEILSALKFSHEKDVERMPIFSEARSKDPKFQGFIEEDSEAKASISSAM